MSVIGATIEDREMAARMAEEEGRTFPIAYGVSEESVGPLAPVVQLDPSILLCGTNRAYAK